MKKTTLLKFQQEAYRRLLEIAKMCFTVSRSTLPVKPRTNSLLVAPSGSGKTHIAQMVVHEMAARGMGISFLGLSAAEWIPLGCSARGATVSWRQIIDALKAGSKADGLVILLDEIDKIGIETSWNTYLRTEIFRVLDLTIPPGLTDEDDNLLSQDTIHKCQETLSNKTLIVAAGAFQSIWETKTQPTIGFQDAAANAPISLSLDDLMKVFPHRELLNRFRSELLLIPPLQRQDYLEMLESVGSAVPSYFRECFFKMGHQKLSYALDCKLGCRFVEEVMADTIILEKRQLQLEMFPENP